MMSKYYYYVTKEMDRTTSHILKCIDEFPIAEINKKNPDKIITFWIEISKKQWDLSSKVQDDE